MITHYLKKRIVTYFLATAVIFVLPFIRINDNHFFLLSFDKQKLNLFFVSFNTNELYLMPFLLIMMFVFIFFITNLLGRVWCGWACPQTLFRMIYRDIIQTKIFKLYSGRKNKQNPIRNNIIKKILSVVFFYIISVIAASNFLWYFIPPEDFFTYIQNPNEHLLLIGIVFFLSLFITFDITYIKENFCAYLCPYARIQSVMFDNDTKMVIYDEGRGGLIYKDGVKFTKKPLGGECVACEACVKVCPTHIDIRKGMQLECINCLECADACSVVQSRFNRPSLINWNSTNVTVKKEKIKYFRAKTIGYLIFLSILLIGLIYKANHKDTMLLNINRTSELYSVKKGKVVNAYSILLQNTDKKEHKFYLEILSDDKNIYIHKPKKAFSIKAGEKSPRILVLKAQCDSTLKEDKNINIKLKAYAVDDDKINIIKDTVFIYPKGELCKIKKHKY
ncbi:cytochrome c oxidase accessory protein CcoG [Campylobacter canadensis]|uniref:cytochrome c oxidase accessory protein CcoG n=1 Tax=Campylobacter canadensis TaxID=449520 RepID=UPI001CCFE3BA|nr:cytochrome c oxidase accessory protein CcoG [Campylobacter canadensis]MBZ8000432.1 cytochrome c oxidase accessory protein CcoG [Campylobacter canadensis]